MLVAGCCTLSVAAQAAGPRDAVKTLPRITHTSDYRITESDNPDSQSYEDSYYDTWDVNWQPQPISLPVGEIGIQLHYIKRLSDRLFRQEGTSSDSRSDQYNFVVRLDRANFVKGHYAIEEVDTANGSYPSSSAASFQAYTRKEAFLTWNPPQFPSISAGHAVTTTSSYTGTERNHSSEGEWTQIKLNYNHDLGLARQQVQYLGELTRTYTFYPSRAGKSVAKQVWDADRTMPLGNIGNLNLGAHLEENNSREETDATGTKVMAAQYSIGLDGNVATFPLSYSVGYLANSQSIQNTSSYDRSQRRITLNFNPPVPEGRSAGLSYNNVYDEYSDAYNDRGVMRQQLSWSFSPNRRVASNIGYELATTVDRLAHVGTQEDETISGSLSYNIPGNRGSFSSTFSQGIQRVPTEDARNTRNSVNLSTSFRLGNSANMTLFYTENHSDNHTRYLVVPAITDNITSGVRYHISPGGGLSLDAKWQQFYQLNLPSTKKTATQNIELVFNWQTAANWNYSLKVASNDTSVQPGNATGSTYRTGDEIQALITYSF